MMAMNCWQTVEMCDKMLQRVQVSRVFQSFEVCATVSAWAELLFLGVRAGPSLPYLAIPNPATGLSGKRRGSAGLSRGQLC